MTVPVQHVSLIEARNALSAAVNKHRGGIPARQDEIDLAFAALDIAITKAAAALSGGRALPAPAAAFNDDLHQRLEDAARQLRSNAAIGALSPSVASYQRLADLLQEASGELATQAAPAAAPGGARELPDPCEVCGARWSCEHYEAAESSPGGVVAGRGLHRGLIVRAVKAIRHMDTLDEAVDYAIANLMQPPQASSTPEARVSPQEPAKRRPWTVDKERNP